MCSAWINWIMNGTWIYLILRRLTLKDWWDLIFTGFHIRLIIVLMCKSDMVNDIQSCQKLTWAAIHVKEQNIIVFLPRNTIFRSCSYYKQNLISFMNIYSAKKKHPCTYNCFHFQQPLCVNMCMNIKIQQLRRNLNNILIQKWSNESLNKEQVNIKSSSQYLGWAPAVNKSCSASPIHGYVIPIFHQGIRKFPDFSWGNGSSPHPPIKEVSDMLNKIEIRALCLPWQEQRHSCLAGNHAHARSVWLVALSCWRNLSATTWGRRTYSL